MRIQLSAREESLSQGREQRNHGEVGTRASEWKQNEDTNNQPSFKNKAKLSVKPETNLLNDPFLSSPLSV